MSEKKQTILTMRTHLRSYFIKKGVLNPEEETEAILNIISRVVSNVRIKSDIQVNEISKEICEAVGITYEAISSKCRKRKIVYARYCFMYRLRNETNLSVSNIADYCNCDHSNVVVHLNKTIPDLLATKDPLFMPYWVDSGCEKVVNN